jgi:cobalt/nickel transport system permease protein
MAGVYMNLTPPIGISAGLGIGLLFIFIVKLFSAVVGHGGWGAVRADTIVNLSEIMVAFCFFRMTKRRLQLFRNVVFRVVILVSGRQRTELQGVALPAYLIQILTLNMIVAVGEAVVTGFVVDYLSRFGPSHRGVIARRRSDVPRPRAHQQAACCTLSSRRWRL